MIWDVTTYAGRTGYVPDAFVFTGTNNPVAPACVGTGNGRIVHAPCLQLHTRASESSPVTQCVPHASVITISCTTQGQGVAGPWGTSKVWDRTSYAGHSGFVPDAWVYTATAKPVAHAC